MEVRSDSKELNKEGVEAELKKAFDKGLFISSGGEIDGVDWGHFDYIMKHEPHGTFSIIGKKDLKNFYPHMYRVVKNLMGVIVECSDKIKDTDISAHTYKDAYIEAMDAVRFYKGLLIDSGHTKEELEARLDEYKKYLDEEAERIHAEVMAKKAEVANGNE